MNKELTQSLIPRPQR